MKKIKYAIVKLDENNNDFEKLKGVLEFSNAGEIVGDTVELSEEEYNEAGATEPCLYWG